MGTQSQAQQQLPLKKVQTTVMPIALITVKSNLNPQGFQTAARFFKVKNARVKQALLFKPRVRLLFFA
ncbi:hypothetical protein BTR34_13615 [Maribacter hydrothermalis]|nr:hypothetical protein BTR34_13615 [Maribacter hydrothermalis]